MKHQNVKNYLALPHMNTHYQTGRRSLSSQKGCMEGRKNDPLLYMDVCMLAGSNKLISSSTTSNHTSLYMRCTPVYIQHYPFPFPFADSKEKELSLMIMATTLSFLSLLSSLCKVQ